MKKFFLIVFLIAGISAFSQSVKWSEELARTAMKIWPDSFTLEGDKVAKWRYDQGVILKGIEKVWTATGDGEWFKYIQQSMDFYVMNDGTIRGYKPGEYNIDHINNGKLLLTLYRVTGKEKYKKAADLLRSQLLTHPRTSEGGFWHKKIYPWQMWLDGLYMGQPFYAEYAMLFRQDTAFRDIAKQFILSERYTRDAKTGLLYHGWDESREQQWANKQTGTSPHFWGRALGWYGMAMVDALEYFPLNHPGRDSILGILNRFVKAIVKVQDPASGVWFDIVNMPKEKGNYKEASASCMLVYTLAKAIRNGYIPESYLSAAKKGYAGIIKEFIRRENGQVNLHGTVSVSGLGGKPYRDGSFSYYISEPVIVNDPKGMGAFINCAAEMELLETRSTAAGKKVLLDRYYNSEKRKDVNDSTVYWHYVWNERSHPGFYVLGEIFKKYGATLDNLDTAPTAAKLKNTSVYIIVDPDHQKDNPSPNYMTTADAKIICEWVKAGGVLLLMANDSANCDLKHFNQLSTEFGIRFTDKSRNMVKGDEFETGAVEGGHPIFHKRKMYLKEISVLELKKPATVILEKEGDPVLAIARYGKGTAIAVGDPWLYNEYVDGRKLPEPYDNHGAADDLVRWMLKQGKK